MAVGGASAPEMEVMGGGGRGRPPTLSGVLWKPTVISLALPSARSTSAHVATSLPFTVTSWSHFCTPACSAPRPGVTYVNSKFSSSPKPSTPSVRVKEAFVTLSTPRTTLGDSVSFDRAGSVQATTGVPSTLTRRSPGFMPARSPGRPSCVYVTKRLWSRPNPSFPCPACETVILTG